MHVMFGKEIEVADRYVIVPEVVTITTIELKAGYRGLLFALCHVLDSDRDLVIPIRDLKDYEEVAFGISRCNDGVFDVERQCEICSGRNEIEDCVRRLSGGAGKEHSRNARAF